MSRWSAVLLLLMLPLRLAGQNPIQASFETSAPLAPGFKRLPDELRGILEAENVRALFQYFYEDHERPRHWFGGGGEADCMRDVMHEDPDMMRALADDGMRQIREDSDKLDARALYTLGLVMGVVGRGEDEIRCYELGIQQTNYAHDVAQMRKVLTLIYDSRDQTEKLIDVHRAAIRDLRPEVRSSRKWHLRRLTLLYERLGEQRSAEETFALLQMLDPEVTRESLPEWNY